MNLYSIIVIYNGMRRDWIQKCFSSIEASSVPVKIIAIDNASTDDSVHYIKANFPNVLLIESKENLGFGGANNVGLRKALELGGEYFFLLNQDAWTEPDTIEELVEQSKINPEYGVISPMHLNGKGDALDYNFSNQISPISCPGMVSDFILNEVKNEVYPAKFVCAAAWLMTKKCLQKVGGFSPTFYHYGEDDNYAQRIYFKKLKLGIFPFSRIYHDREQRPLNDFQKETIEKRRSWIIKFSNPNKPVNLSNHIKVLKNKRLKAFLTGDRSTAKKLKEEIAFFSENLNLVKHNLERSKSSQEFIFLHDEQQ